MGKSFGFVATCLIGSVAGIAAGLMFPAGLVGASLGAVALTATGTAAGLATTYQVASKFAE